jgi:hypothetical protein
MPTWTRSWRALAVASLVSGQGCRAFGATSADFDRGTASPAAILAQLRTAEAPAAPPGAAAEAPPAASTAAVVMLTAPVDVERGVKAWRESLRSTGGALIESGAMSGVGYNECAEIAEIPGAFVCLSFFELDMNKMLGRAGVYAEGGYVLPRGTFPKETDPDVRKLNLEVEGQDLKSEDLVPFFDGMLARCAAGDKDLCLNPSETAFYANVLKPIEAKFKKFVILGFSAQSFDSYQVNLGHEMMHAQYMMQPKFKDVVDRFWAAMPDADKAAIRRILAKNAYDPRDEFLMRNEFQAYLLEPEAAGDMMKDYVPKYRQAVIEALARQNVTPIQVQ